MKVYGQLEKAQAENTTSDTGSLPKGFITYRTDLNLMKVSNGTSMLAMVDESSSQTLTNKTLTAPVLSGTITGTYTLGGTPTISSPSISTPTITTAATFTQVATPSNPAANNNKLYFKADGNLYMLSSAGTETQVNGGGGSSSFTTIPNGGSVTGTYTGDVFIPSGASVNITANVEIHGNLIMFGNISNTGAFSLDVFGNISGNGILSLARATGGAGSLTCRGNVAGDLFINTSATTSGSPGSITIMGNCVAKQILATAAAATGGNVTIYGDAVISGDDGGNIDCILMDGTNGGTLRVGGNLTCGTWDPVNTADVAGNISATGTGSGANGNGGRVFVEGNLICPFVFVQGAQLGVSASSSGSGGAINVYGNLSCSVAFAGGGSTGSGSAGAGGSIVIGGNVTSIMDTINGGNGSGGDLPSLSVTGGSVSSAGTVGNAGNGGTIKIGGVVTAQMSASGGSRASATNAGTAGNGGTIHILGGAAGIFSTVTIDGGANVSTSAKGSAGTLNLYGSSHSFHAISLQDGSTGTAPTTDCGINFAFGSSTIGSITATNRTNLRFYNEFRSQGTGSAIVKINSVSGKNVFTNMTAANTFGANTGAITTTSLYTAGNGTWRATASAAA